jgi:mediator of RNA polymerase II transcription subunit 7
MQFSGKIEHLRKLMIYIHHQVNEFRPIQAKDTLAFILNQQIERRIALQKRIDQKVKDTKEEYRRIILEIEGVL